MSYSALCLSLLLSLGQVKILMGLHRGHDQEIKILFLSSCFANEWACIACVPSAKQAFVTATLNRSFPVYLLITCLSSKRETWPFCYRMGIFNAKKRKKKSQFWVFTMFAPFPSRDVFWVPGDKSVASTSRILKRTSFSLCSQSQLQANVFSVETLLLSGHYVNLFCGLRERISGQ